MTSQLRPTRPPLSAAPGLAIVALALLSAATARAQPPESEPKREAEISRAYALPRQAVEAMRREVDAIRKKKDAADAINRAIPAPEQAVVRQLLIENQRRAIELENERRAIPFPEPVVVWGGGNFKPALVQQWTRQIHPILQVEYRFLRTVCNPSKDKRIPIARAGLDALKDAAMKYAEWHLNPRRVVRTNANGVMTVQIGSVPDVRKPDIRKLIQDALAVAVKEHLSPEQLERYRKEVEARSEGQRRAGVQYLVAKLDQSLLLDSEQREKISTSLANQWDESWFSVLDSILESQSQSLPMIPDPIVIPFLNGPQREKWSGIQKVALSPAMSSADMNEVEGPLDDEFPDEATQAGPKPGAEQ